MSPAGLMVERPPAWCLSWGSGPCGQLWPGGHQDLLGSWGAATSLPAPAAECRQQRRNSKLEVLLGHLWTQWLLRIPRGQNVPVAPAGHKWPLVLNLDTGGRLRSCHHPIPSTKEGGSALPGTNRQILRTLFLDSRCPITFYWPFSDCYLI